MSILIMHYIYKDTHKYKVKLTNGSKPVLHKLCYNIKKGALFSGCTCIVSADKRRVLFSLKTSWLTCQSAHSFFCCFLFLYRSWNIWYVLYVSQKWCSLWPSVQPRPTPTGSAGLAISTQKALPTQTSSSKQGEGNTPQPWYNTHCHIMSMIFSLGLISYYVLTLILISASLNRLKRARDEKHKLRERQERRGRKDKQETNRTFLME